MKLKPRNRRRRGQVLIMTAFLIFVLFTLALSFFKLVPMELNSALKTKQALTAQVVADSGVNEARVWLESQPPQRILNQSVLDAEFNLGTTEAAIPLGDTFTQGASNDEMKGRWRYDVKLTPNPTAPFAFDAVSTCYFDDQPVRQVRATLARENFSRYALFIDQWRNDLVMEVGAGAIQGPFHTNDFFRLVILPNSYQPGAEPFVSGVNGVMTHAGATSEGSLPFVGQTGDGNAYYDGSSSSFSPNSSASAVPYNENGEIESRYDSLVAGGRSNLTSTDHVLLPYSADELLVQSLGGEDSANVQIPSDIGLYIETEGSNNVKGGIYIAGDVEVDLSIDSNGNQVHNYTQSIPVEAYRYVTQEQYQHPIYGNVSRTVELGDTYNQSTQVTQSVGVQTIVGYETQSVTTTRQIQTGQTYVSGGGGGTSVGTWQPVYSTVTDTSEVQVPIYDTVMEDRTTTVSSPVTITDPNDPRIGTSVNSYELIGHEDRTRDVVNEIDSDTYEANPSAYPGATRFFRPGPPKTATVTEVAGPSPQTIFVDYEGVARTLDGALNGVTFVDGNVVSIKGVSKGAQDTRFPDGDVFQGRYIVANPARQSKGTMTIEQDLLQYYNGSDSGLRGAQPHTLKVGELSPNSQHALGLISRETFLRPSANDPLNLYAVMIAGHSIRGTEDANGIPNVEGGFGAHESIMQPGYGSNSFHLFGGLVQANQRLWKEGSDGLNGNFSFDAAVAGDMPRFPRSNKVTILRYADRYVNDEESI